MKTTSLVMALALAAPGLGWPQVAGHDTVPAQGPAARSGVAAREADDAVLVQVERLRRDLADLSRRYRKAKGAERDALAQRAQPLLDRMAMALRELSEAER
jgi:hypothetical protein